MVLHTAAPRSFYESLPKLRRFSDASNLRIRDTELLHLTRRETHQVALSCGCRTCTVSLVGLDGFGGCVCRDVPSIGLDKEPRSGGTDIGILDKGVTAKIARVVAAATEVFHGAWQIQSGLLTFLVQVPPSCCLVCLA